MGDLWIGRPYVKTENWCRPEIYSMNNAAQLVGGNEHQPKVNFIVTDLETFQVCMSDIIYTNDVWYRLEIDRFDLRWMYNMLSFIEAFILIYTI